MNWYKRSQQVWGQAGSGIMFMCPEDKTILLVLRSQSVMDSGTWGIPGGAISGTDEYFDQDEVDGSMFDTEDLWNSAVNETQEEIGYFPQKYEVVGRKENKKGNFVFTTFIVSISQEEKAKINENMTLNSENDDSRWVDLETAHDMKNMLHKGVYFVLPDADKILNSEGQRITQPYYRVVSMSMFGSRIQNPDKTGESTYWTPRWDAIQFMVRQMYMLYRTSEIKNHTKEHIKIYKITDAIMKKPPIENRWAFAYGVDAGEMVLVQALSQPELIIDCPIDDPQIENIIENSLEVEAPKNHAYDESLRVEYNGQSVYLSPDYRQKAVVVAQKIPNSWEFQTVALLRSSQEVGNFLKKCKFNQASFDMQNSLGWFEMDMGWIQDQSPENEEKKYDVA